MSYHATSVIECARSARENKHKKGATAGLPSSASRNAIPSPRNQEIFRRVTVNCEQQSTIAAELNLSPGRISQIISRVRQWLGQGSQCDPAHLSQVEAKRLARSVARAQHENIYQLTIREFHRQSQSPKHTTIRTEAKPTTNDDQTSSSFNPEPKAKDSETPQSEISNLQSEITKIVTTLRDHSPNIQFLKVAQRSTIEMQKLSELEPIPEPEAAAPSDLELYESLYSILAHQRQSAEDQGLVPKSHNVFSFVDQFLSALLGQARNIGLPPDAAVRDLLKSFVLGSLPYETYHGEKQLLADTLSGEDIPVCQPPSPTPTRSVSEENPPYPRDPEAPCATSLNPAPQPQASPNLQSEIDNLQSNNHPLNTPKPTPAEPPLSLAPTPIPATTSAPTPKPTPTPKPKKFSPPPPGTVMFAPYSPPAPSDPISIATHPWTRPF